MTENFQFYLSKILEVPQYAVSKCTSFYQQRNISKNQILLREGEVSSETFFVQKGLLRMYSIDQNGKEHIIQFAPENWLISDRSSIYFNKKSAYYIDAVEESEVLVLNKNFFSELALQFPKTMENNDLLLQKHIRSLQTRIHSLLSEPAEVRYMNFLKTYPEILQRAPQWMIASYLGITPESLSRVKKDLAEKNFKIN